MCYYSAPEGLVAYSVQDTSITTLYGPEDPYSDIRRPWGASYIALSFTLRITLYVSYLGPKGPRLLISAATEVAARVDIKIQHQRW